MTYTIMYILSIFSIYPRYNCYCKGIIEKSDSAEEANAGGSNAATSKNEGDPTPLVTHLPSNQSFTLERLMGIYSQLALSIDGSVQSQDDGRATYSHRADIYCQQLITSSSSSSGIRSAAATKHTQNVVSPAAVGRYYGDTQLYAHVSA